MKLNCLHTTISEKNEQTLYGFSSRLECKIFEALISAHKIGPALGLAILSTYAPDQLVAIVEGQDVDALCVVLGLGKQLHPD